MSTFTASRSRRTSLLGVFAFNTLALRSAHVANFMIPLRSFRCLTREFLRCDSYSKSKVLAEKAAWELVKSNDVPGSLELAVINPSLVIGPTLSPNVGTSVDIACQILSRKMPATPHACMNVVDVRDVAEGIVRAMVRHGYFSAYDLISPTRASKEKARK